MQLIVNTNNGTERKNKEFKLGYIRDIRDKSLSAMLTILVESFLPEQYRR